MVEALTSLPDSLRAGTTIKLRRSFANFPTSEGWTYKLTLAGPSTVSVDGTVVTGAFEATLDAAKTAALKPGNYRWIETVSLSGEKFTAAEGHIKVERDLEAAAPGDAQTHEERTVSIIEAVLEGRLTDGIESYTIGGRAVTKIPITELRKMLVKYKAAVWRQRNPGKLGQPAKVIFRSA